MAAILQCGVFLCDLLFFCKVHSQLGSVWSACPSSLSSSCVCSSLSCFQCMSRVTRPVSTLLLIQMCLQVVRQRERVKGKFVLHWSQRIKQSTQSINFTTAKLRGNHLWSCLLDMACAVDREKCYLENAVELTCPSSAFYKNYSTEMLFLPSASSSPSSSSSWPLSQPVPMIRCKCLPSVRWIMSWLSARKCFSVLTSSVICWCFFYYCGFLLLFVFKEYINFSSGNHQVDGRKVEQVPSCHLPQQVPQGAWVVSGGWRIAAPPPLLTQLPAPEIKLDHRHCVLVKDMDHVKREYCKNLRYTCINSCDCWDSIFIDFSGSSALLEIHSLN